MPDKVVASTIIEGPPLDAIVTTIDPPLPLTLDVYPYTSETLALPNHHSLDLSLFETPPLDDIVTATNPPLPLTLDLYPFTSEMLPLSDHHSLDLSLFETPPPAPTTGVLTDQVLTLIPPPAIATELDIIEEAEISTDAEPTDIEPTQVGGDVSLDIELSQSEIEPTPWLLRSLWFFSSSGLIPTCGALFAIASVDTQRSAMTDILPLTVANILWGLFTHTISRHHFGEDVEPHRWVLLLHSICCVLLGCMVPISATLISDFWPRVGVLIGVAVTGLLGVGGLASRFSSFSFNIVFPFYVIAGVVFYVAQFFMTKGTIRTRL